MNHALGKSNTPSKTKTNCELIYSSLYSISIASIPSQLFWKKIWLHTWISIKYTIAFVNCFYNNDPELLRQNNPEHSSYVKKRHINDEIFYQRPVESVRPKIREIEREREEMKKSELHAQCGKYKFQARLSQF